MDASHKYSFFNISYAIYFYTILTHTVGKADESAFTDKNIDLDIYINSFSRRFNLNHLAKHYIALRALSFLRFSTVDTFRARFTKM